LWRYCEIVAQLGILEQVAIAMMLGYDRQSVALKNQAIQANNPFNPDCMIGYFEITVEQSGHRGYIVVIFETANVNMLGK